MSLIEQLNIARRTGTPLVGITTSDQPATLNTIMQVSVKTPPILVWDVVRGIRALNSLAKPIVADLAKSAEELQQISTNPQTALEIALKLPANCITVLTNGHRFIADPFVSTGIGMLREPYKKDFRTLIILGPELTLPTELRQDVIVLDDPLPTDSELRDVVKRVHGWAKLDPPAEMDGPVAALRGLAQFTAEQVLAMSLSPEGVDMKALWERKRASVEQVKGLSLLLNGPTYEDIGGNEEFKRYMTALFTGRKPPTCIVWLDEFEKMMAGAQSDSTGVSQDQLSWVLSWMENRGHDGALSVGPPGAGKSLMAQATAHTFGKPLVSWDLGAAKGSFVGESEKAIREQTKVIDTIAAGSAFIIATCNKLESLPPELRRRFKPAPIWYFDIPTADEKQQIWDINMKRFGLAEMKRPDDEKWTGAEIRNCCDIAWRLDKTLIEAAQYIVPVAKSDPAMLQNLRAQAHNRFLSASMPGYYTKGADVEEAPERAMEMVVTQAVLRETDAPASPKKDEKKGGPKGN